MQIDFAAAQRSLLVTYRDAHNLPVTTPYRNASAQYILATGIGSRSPTIVQDRTRRRCTKEEVAAVVRKHYKEASVPETECLVEVCYRVKTRGKFSSFSLYLAQFMSAQKRSN